MDETSLARELVRAIAYALERMGNDRADNHTTTTTARRGRSPAVATLLTAECLDALDVDAIARWFVDHYPTRRYPGVVIGSPNGASAHLAAVLGMPYLPSSFDVKVAWPGGVADDAIGALAFGVDLAARLLSGNATPMSVRQVHDPATPPGLQGWPVHLVVRWRGLPAAYRSFLKRCLGPGGSVVLVSDARVWPVTPVAGGMGFQVGRVASGLEPPDYEPDSDVALAMLRAAGAEPERWNPPSTPPLGSAEHGLELAFALSVRHWARGVGAAVQRVLYSRPAAWSAAVADVYRAWFAQGGEPATHCIVECGRQLDPWNTLSRAAVPYWCENPTRASVAAAEWWLAGTPRFPSIDVIPESPGLRLRPYATLSQWASVAWFGERRGRLSRSAAGFYPDQASPPKLATLMLSRLPTRIVPVPGPTLAFAVDVLDAGRTTPGLVVSRPPH